MRNSESILASRLRALGLVLICAKVALVPLVFDPAADFAFTVPKAAISHGLAILLAGVMLALYVRLGRVFLVWSPLHVPVLAFLAANAAATIFAPYVSLAVFGTHARMLGLATVVDWGLLYFAVALLVRNSREMLAIALAALAASVGVLAYEFMQFAGKDPLPWPDQTQLMSTVGNRTTLGEYLIVLSMGAVAIGIAATGLGTRARITACLISVGLLVGAIATGARSQILGLGVGIATLVVLIWVLHPARNARIASLAFAAAAVVVLGVALVLTPLGSRVATTFEPPTPENGEDLLSRLEPSAAGRVALYRIAWEMIRERPIFGYGPDELPIGVAQFRSENDPPEQLRGLATSSHSWVAYVGAGSGLIGLACFLAIVVVGLRLTVKGGFRVTTIAATTALATLLGAGLTTITDVGIDWIFWAAAGAIAGATATVSEIRSVSRARVQKKRRHLGTLARRPSPAQTLGGVAVLGAALVLAASGAVAIDASHSAKRGNDLRLAGRYPDAIESLLRATRADGGRPEYWHFLGLAYAAAGRWTDASGAFERAALIAPYDVRHLGDEARAKLILGRAGDRAATSAAIALADEAVQVDANSPYSHLTRAVVMQVVGNLAEAERSVDRSLSLDPTATEETVYVTAAQIKIDRGRPAEAVLVAQQGLAVLGPSPRSVPLRYELARALVGLGKFAEALSVLDVALAIAPNASAEQLRAQLRASKSN